MRIGVSKKKYASSQQQLRDGNKLSIFNLIRKAPASRITLAKLAKLSPTTVSTLVEDLISTGWVIESETVNSTARGRRPIMLSVNASRGYIATVELLSRGYICTIYDICLNRVSGLRVRNSPCGSVNISATICELLRAKRIPLYRLLGIHVMFPGMINANTNELRFSAVISKEDMPESSFIQELEKRFPETQVLLSTNGSIIAFAEFISTEQRSSLPLLSINIDEGIIGGVVMCDRQSETRVCFPIEIGHIIIDLQGTVCKCGNHGCLEALCSTVQLFRMVNERTDMDLTYSESFGADCNLRAMEQIAQRLAQYDSALTTVLSDYVYNLCCGLVSVVNLIGVQSIRIGGDISVLGSTFLNMVRTTLHEQFYPLNSTDSIEIELINSDYEHVRCAMVIMSMDELFKR